MIMTPSPVLAAYNHPSPHTSPHLLPKTSNPNSGSSTPINITTPRSYARPPPIRPYQSALCSRGWASGRGSNGHGRAVKEMKVDPKAFGELVAVLVKERVEKGLAVEGEKVELIVDYPVWSPGSFQGESAATSLSRHVQTRNYLVLTRLDLSTLHALRDTTLTHVHALLSYLSTTHKISASYRLLARSTSSAPTPGTSPTHPIPNNQFNQVGVVSDSLQSRRHRPLLIR